MQTVFERKIWRRPVGQQDDRIIEKEQQNNYKRWKDYINDQQEEMERIRKIMSRADSSHFQNTAYVRVIVSQYSREYLHIIRREDIAELNAFKQDMQQWYTNNDVDHILWVEAGIYCCCIDAAVWRRCQITKVLPHQKCEVRFIDDGTTNKRVNWEQLRMLSDTYANKPPFAMKCVLMHMNSTKVVERIAPNEDRHFRQRLRENTVFYASRVTKFHGRKIGIYLHCRDGNGDLKCMNSNFMDDDGDTTCDEVFDEHILMPGPDVFNDKTIRRNRFTRRSAVKISHFVDLEEVHFTLLSNLPALSKLHIDVQHAGELSSEQEQDDSVQYTTGSFCLVKCVVQPEMEHRWYRGEIIQVNEPNYTVHLRDHGNKVDVLKTALLPVPESLPNVDSMSKQMSLFGIKSKHLEFSDETVREKFTEKILEFDELAVSLDMKSKEWLDGIVWGVRKTVYPLKPTRYTYTNLNIWLVRQGLVTATESQEHVDNMFPSVLPIPNLAANRVRKERAAVVERYPRLAHFKKEPMKFNPHTKVVNIDRWIFESIIRKSKCVVFPTHVDSKLNIYVQDEYRRHIAERIKQLLTEKVRKRRTTGFRCKRFDEWKTGEPCFAPFRDFYLRATFIRINRSNKCEVQFIDYGYKVECDVRHILVANMFGGIPPMAEQCYLPGIKPKENADGPWPVATIQYTLDKIIGAQCFLKRIDGRGVRNSCVGSRRVHPCTLYIYSSANDLKSLLIQKNHATVQLIQNQTKSQIKQSQKSN